MRRQASNSNSSAASSSASFVSQLVPPAVSTEHPLPEITIQDLASVFRDSTYRASLFDIDYRSTSQASNSGELARTSWSRPAQLPKPASSLTSVSEKSTVVPSNASSIKSSPMQCPICLETYDEVCWNAFFFLQKNFFIFHFFPMSELSTHIN